MNSINGSPETGNSLLKLLAKIGNGILMLFVTPIMLLNEFRRELSKDVYSGWSGAFRAAIGALLAFSAAGGVGYHLGWELGWRSWGWVSTGVLAWFATYCFAWPLFYLFPVKPAFKLAELFWDGFERLAKSYAESIFGGTVRAVSSILPGSSSAWTKLLVEKKDNWVTKTVIGLSYPVSLAGSAYLGHTVYQLVLAGLGSALLGTTLGVGAGLLAGLTLAGALWQCISEGKLPFVAIALGFGLDRVFSPELNGAAALVSSNVYVGVGLHLLAVVAFVSYVFPLIMLALAGGLIKWLVEKLKPINEKAYDDRDNDYRAFFGNVTTLAVTGIAVWQAYIWASAISLPLWGLVPALAVLGLAVYLWFYDVVDHGGGTFITGALVSLYAGWKVGAGFDAWGHAGGIWMAIPLGVVSVLVVAAVLFPLAYLALKSVLVTLRVSKLGKPLAKLHDAVEKGCHKVARELMHAYDNSYHDRSGYQVWFLHAGNLALAIAAALALPQLSGHLPSFAAPAASWIASQVFVGLLSYILVGRFLQKSTIGTEFVGAISSLAFAVWLSSVTLAAGASWWSLTIVGVLAWTAGFALLFPAAYIVLRLPLKYLLASWSTVVLVKLHDFAWSCFVVVWDRFVAVYRLLDRIIFEPLRDAIAAASHKVSDAYGWLRDKILGRK